MEVGVYMEEIKMMSNVGYYIGKKAKLNEFEVLRLLELIKYGQYNDFLNHILPIAKSVEVPIPDQIYKYDYDTFETYIHALCEGFIKSYSNLNAKVY